VELPELGVGVVYFAGLESWLEAGADLVDVLEIEPQPFWYRSPTGARYRLNEHALARFRSDPRPKLVHGVGFPIGGTRAPDEEHVAPFVETATVLGSAWVSEHLSFNRARRGSAELNTGVLLPPVQTDTGVELAVANIRRLQAALPVPFAFETGVSYLRPVPGEMSDGAFFRAIAEEADCGILLDLHNLWANERNGRQRLLDVVAELPLERVVEVHLAGGEPFGDYWMDAHSGPSPRELDALAAEVIARLPCLKAIVFEMLPDYIAARGYTERDFLDQLERMHRLWERRGRGPVSAPAVRARALDAAAPSPRDWEDALGGLLAGDPPHDRLTALLADDPGVGVLRNLVATMRGGMAVTALTLTCRLLMIHLGQARFQALLEAFWAGVPPEPFASDEAAHLGAFLRAQAPPVPHLLEVLSFELAAQRMLIEGAAPPVAFTCDPLPLLTALGEGRLPESIAAGEFELVLDPPAPAAG
jgi:uncharacterized protein (UPF0276 family)